MLADLDALSVLRPEVFIEDQGEKSIQKIPLPMHTRFVVLGADMPLETLLAALMAEPTKKIRAQCRDAGS